MKNQFNKKEEEPRERKPRIRSAAYRWAMERIDAAVEQAERVKSDRLWELERMAQIEAIEEVRRKLFGEAATAEPPPRNLTGAGRERPDVR